jgi:hypothetical protein
LRHNLTFAACLPGHVSERSSGAHIARGATTVLFSSPGSADERSRNGDLMIRSENIEIMEECANGGPRVVAEFSEDGVDVAFSRERVVVIFPMQNGFSELRAQRKPDEKAVATA